MSCKESWDVTLTKDEIRLIRRAIYEKIKIIIKDIHPEAYSPTFCDKLYGLCCEMEKYTTLLKRFGEKIDEKGGKV